MTTTGTSFVYNRTSQSSQWKLSSISSQGKVLNSNVEMTQAGRIRFSSTMFWLICQTNALGATWTCQNVFAAGRPNWLQLASWWNISSVLCPFLATPHLNWTIQNLCRFRECCSVLQRSFVVCLHHSSSTFATCAQNRPEQVDCYLR